MNTAFNPACLHCQAGRPHQWHNKQWAHKEGGGVYFAGQVPPKLESEILKFCHWLRESADTSGDFAFWPHAPAGQNECGVCTNGARLIARRFGGRVCGYAMSTRDSDDLIAKDCFGHDFAIVGDYLVDWWAWDYPESLPHPILHLQKDAALIAKYYKPQSEWVTL
jgi:hypothetical protein